MDSRKISNVSILFTVFVIVASLDLVLSGPIAIPTNGRALRSVNFQRRNSWDENPVANLLLSQQQPEPTNNENSTIFAQRENNSGDGATTSVGDGSIHAEVVSEGGGNGTVINDTQVGSRLKQNETEPCSLEPSILCSSDPTHSNRDKQRRIAHIVNYVWTNLFGNRTRPVSKESMRERFNPANPSSSSFSGGLETITASCDLPPEVESEAWSSRRYFSLYFNLASKYPELFGSAQDFENSSESQQQQQQSRESGQSHEYLPAVGTQPLLSSFTITPNKAVNIISAKLRLYKMGSSENTNVPEMEPSEPCNDTETTLSFEELVPNVLPTRVTFPEFSPSTNEKIRVSVFWYTQPATKNHYKKKLVDTKMLSVRESSWVEFDIKNAATAWLNDRRPNYGLVIEVENENQDVLDPTKYFSGAPCFRSESERASLMEGSGSGEGNIRGQTNQTLSPVIEICTLNLPETTTNYEHTKKFPLSMNINSLNHLQRIAESHARSRNATGSSPARYPWQNFNTRVLSPQEMSNTNRRSQTKPTTVAPTHRHRHHHELNTENNVNGAASPLGSALNNQHQSQTGQNQHQRNKSRFSHPREFSLDEDHPLREILATVNGNSKESSKNAASSSGSQNFAETFGKGFPSHLIPEMPADEGRVDDYSTEHDRDVFITKIILTPAQLKESGLNGIINARGLLPLLASTSPPSSVNTGKENR